MIDRRRNTGRAWPAAARLALTLLLPLLVACGGTPAATAPPATSAPSSTPAAAPTSAATPATPARTATAPPTTTPQPTRTAAAAPAAIPTHRPAATATRASGTATSNTGSGGGSKTAQFARSGLAGTALTALAVGGEDGQLLFAGGQGLWRSTDAGEHWTQVRGATEAPQVTAIVIAPSDPQIVYVGVSEGCTKGGSLPGLVTTDGGASWRQSGQDLSSIAVDPRDARRLYATTCAGVQRSLDGGTTWETLGKAQLDGYTPTLIALVPRAPRTLYVAYCIVPQIR